MEGSGAAAGFTAGAQRRGETFEGSISGSLFPIGFPLRGGGSLPGARAQERAAARGAALGSAVGARPRGASRGVGGGGSGGASAKGGEPVAVVGLALGLVVGWLWECAVRLRGGLMLSSLMVLIVIHRRNQTAVHFI